MKANLLNFCIISYMLSACDGISPSGVVNSIDLNEPYKITKAYRGQIFKVCGWATKSFENVQITNTREEGWRDIAIGFGVDWLETEPYTDKPEWRCVTGKIIPTCGWDDYDDPDLICRSTGHGFEHKIHQVKLKRD